MYREYSMSSVVLKDAYCVNAFQKEVVYLLKLDEERLMAGFYETAGLDNGKTRYLGWENMLIGGHTLGHYLTACAQAYNNQMATEDDREKLYYKITKMIDGLLECQNNTKGKTGFIFGATINNTKNVEAQFDFVEQGKIDIMTQAWVPWYTMHKILDGIIMTYILTGYENALKVASALGDWTYNRVSTWSDKTHRAVLDVEYGGMNDALYKLYAITKKKEHLVAAHFFDEDDLFEKVATGDVNVLNNKHANTTIPKFLGALNRYIVVGETEEKYLEYAIKFFDMVLEKHTYVTGGNSEWEHFGEDNILDKERTNCNNETCNTYNMLKMARNLFMITGDKKYSDYYENTFINAILSSQNPETGMTMYFQPMATGYFKTYSREFDNFWCCTGSGMENFSKLGDSIYFKDDNRIITNMYFASILKDDELEITMEQKADMPSSENVEFIIDTANDVNCELAFRIPDWAWGYGVMVNGEEIEFGVDRDYIVISRSWTKGDRIQLSFAMGVVAFGLPDCENVYAFKYGPVLLSANLGNKNMLETTTGVNVTIPEKKIIANEKLTVLKYDVEEFVDNIDEYFDIDIDKLTFTLTGVKEKLTFGPHYLKYRERYGIYWYLG